jgi:hypothetical protein
VFGGRGGAAQRTGSAINPLRCSASSSPTEPFFFGNTEPPKFVMRRNIKTYHFRGNFIAQVLAKH